MNSRTILAALVAVALSTGMAWGQDTAPAPDAGAKANAPGQSQPPPAQQPSTPQADQPAAQTQQQATPAAPATPNPEFVAAQERIASVRSKGKALPAPEKDAAAKQVKDLVGGIDAEAAAKGDAIVAGRLAPEFGMTTDELMAQRTRYASGWGDLMIAHTLLGGAKTDMTIDELYLLRSEGMGWGEIAHGMGLKIGPTMSALNSEGQVARGLAKPDGKPEKIAGAEGAAPSAPASVGKSAEGKSAAPKGEEAASAAPKGEASKSASSKGAAPKGQPTKSKAK